MSTNEKFPFPRWLLVEILSVGLVLIGIGLWKMGEWKNGSLKAGPQQTAVQTAYPYCADAKPLPIGWDKNSAETNMHKECFGGLIQIPLNWPKALLQAKEGKGFFIWFQGDRRPRFVPPGGEINPKTPEDFVFRDQAFFRVMGEGLLLIKRGEVDQ